MNLLSGSSDAMRKYKEELLGSSTEVDTPDEYTYIGLARDMGMSYTAFKSIPILDRAKTIAQLYLSNMVDVIRRHDTLQRQKMEKFQKSKKSK